MITVLVGSAVGAVLAYLLGCEAVFFIYFVLVAASFSIILAGVLTFLMPKEVAEMKIMKLHGMKVRKSSGLEYTVFVKKVEVFYGTDDYLFEVESDNSHLHSKAVRSSNVETVITNEAPKLEIIEWRTKGLARYCCIGNHDKTFVFHVPPDTAAE